MFPLSLIMDHYSVTTFYILAQLLHRQFYGRHDKRTGRERGKIGLIGLEMISEGGIIDDLF